MLINCCCNWPDVALDRGAVNAGLQGSDELGFDLLTTSMAFVMPVLATPTVEEPKPRASDTDESAWSSERIVVAMDEYAALSAARRHDSGWSTSFCVWVNCCCLRQICRADSAAKLVLMLLMGNSIPSGYAGDK